jgi:uncharacterized membrane protein YhaH (DUF805 family)
MDVTRVFSFSGRINRGAFWALALLSLVPLLLFLVNDTIGILGYLVSAWISLATSVKRWHDRGKGGEWVLISFIPLVGGIWLLVENGFLPGAPTLNRYGPPNSGSPFGGGAGVGQTT